MNIHRRRRFVGVERIGVALAGFVALCGGPLLAHSFESESGAHRHPSDAEWIASAVVPRGRDGRFLLARAEVPVPVLAVVTAGVGTSGGTDPFSVFEKFGTKVRLRRDAGFAYVESDGIPAHRMMVGIRAWQQQVPLPQRYTGNNAWRIPVKPVPADRPLSAKDHFFRGAIALAANGVPIFNPIKNDGQTDTFIAGELDEFGGHSGRADDYHYHLAPTHLQEAVGAGNPVAVALDGYPIYGFREPDGSPVKDLDPFNGHTTAASGYHYHATRTYPYLNGGFHGVVVERGGQVDPQPQAEGVRPALTPLRGARITGFTAESGKRFDLEYQVSGKTNHVRYELESDGGVKFEFVDAVGQVKTARYEASVGGRGGGRGGEGRDGREGREVGEDGGRRRREPGGGRGGRDGGLRPPEAGRGPDAGATNRLPWLRAHLVEIDSDGDGELTRAELTAEVEKTMARLDADRNGSIAVAEKQGPRGGGGTAMSGFVGQHWEEVDADGNGLVTRAEVEAVAKRMFERADSDRDGKLSRAEIAAMTAGRERGPGVGGRKP